MSGSEISIDSLRREIDKLDDAIHDLLMRRTELAQEVGRLKRRERDGRIFMRPAREAEVLRHVLDRHRGPFAKSALLRVWREIMAATLRTQGPISIAVCAPMREGAMLDAWDLARDHFGSDTPIEAFTLPREVVREVMVEETRIGVVPMPRPGEPAPWWPELLALGEERPQVIARLPFLAPTGEAPGAEPVLVLSQTAFEPSGRDRSLIAIEGPAGEEAIAEGIGRAGLEARWLGEAPGAEMPARHLFEVTGFIAPGDARLASLSAEAAGSIGTLARLGGFATLDASA